MPGEVGTPCMRFPLLTTRAMPSLTTRKLGKTGNRVHNEQGELLSRPTLNFARSCLCASLTVFDKRSVFGPEEGGGLSGTEQTERGLEAATTRRIVKARGYAGLAPGEALARALGHAIALGCISPRRYVLSEPV